MAGHINVLLDLGQSHIVVDVDWGLPKHEAQLELLNVLTVHHVLFVYENCDDLKTT